MNSVIPFLFRNKTCSCNCYVDISVDPCFVFVTLRDEELITEFGSDVVIKTDCITVLPRINDYREFVELTAAIFQEFKTTPEFIAAKTRRLIWDELQKRNTKPPLKSIINELATEF